MHNRFLGEPRFKEPSILDTFRVGPSLEAHLYLEAPSFEFLSLQEEISSG